MNKQTKFILFIVLLVLLIGGLALFSTKKDVEGIRKMDNFAQCISDSGAKFYGTFWCNYCQEQKKMFGSSRKYLPYVECSTPNGQGQLDVCKQENIESYPTWSFADGSRVSGLLSFNVLSERTQCILEE